MRLRGVKQGVLHRSGCDCVQKSMRLVSEYTKVVATSFDGSDEFVCRLTATVAVERKPPLRLSPAAFGDAGRRYFRGTSYHAAHWIYPGETRGLVRMDLHLEASGREFRGSASSRCAATRGGGPVLRAADVCSPGRQRSNQPAEI